MAKNPSTKGAPSKVTNTRRRDRRTARRESSLRLRVSEADKRVTQLKRDGAEAHVLAQAEAKANKLNRMYNAHKNARTRHSGGKNLTSPNVPRRARSIEGGAFGKGTHTFGVDMERHHVSSTMRHNFKLVGSPDGPQQLKYTGTQNIHTKPENFDLMRAA